MTTILRRANQTTLASSQFVYTPWQDTCEQASRSPEPANAAFINELACFPVLPTWCFKSEHYQRVIPAPGITNAGVQGRSTYQRVRPTSGPAILDIGFGACMTDRFILLQVLRTRCMDWSMTDRLFCSGRCERDVQLEYD